MTRIVPGISTDVEGEPGFLPLVIPQGETFVVPANRQALFVTPIQVDGTLQVDGQMHDVSRAVVVSDGVATGTVSQINFPGAIVGISGSIATVTIQGGSGQDSFETVAQSLAAYPQTINRTNGRVTSVVYTLPNTTTITKTINRTNDLVSSIVLSGATPAGIQLTKTFTRTNGVITGISYS
jgi:hypothetical protein